MPDNKTITELLYKHLQGTLSDEESIVLNEWKTISVNNGHLVQELSDEKLLAEALEEFHTDNKNELRDRILKKISDRKAKTAIVVHRVHFLKTAWFRYAAAIILIFGVGAYLWDQNSKLKSKNVKATSSAEARSTEQDVLPGSNRAVLTLSDGRKVELTSETGNIRETGIIIQNTDGRLEYGKAEKVVFNTMSTPRGGQYQLTLPDGTNVWLNAASSITYPTAFVNNVREVTITGEAYFEVRRNPSKPFVVKTPKEDITVLGTSFNVNSYTDEPAAKIALSEGSIKVNGKILKPRQAYINGKIAATSIAKDLAWKNGEFSFEDMDVKQAMRQLGRWYDIEVVYQNEPPAMRFFGSISRSAPLSTVLRALKKSNVKVKLEGKKLIIE